MNKNFKTLTLQDAKRLLKKNGGSLYLSNTQLTALPDGLTVEGNLDLRNTPITALPEDLTVGGYLDLSNTPITACKFIRGTERRI